MPLLRRDRDFPSSIQLVRGLDAPPATRASMIRRQHLLLYRSSCGISAALHNVCSRRVITSVYVHRSLARDAGGVVGLELEEVVLDAVVDVGDVLKVDGPRS